MLGAGGERRDRRVLGGLVGREELEGKECCVCTDRLQGIIALDEKSLLSDFP